MNHLFYSLVKLEDATIVEKTRDLLLTLNHKYSLNTCINFNYIHDFIYGFDWYRWCRQDMKKRARKKLYDLDFLTHLNKRADEIIKIVESREDPKYKFLDKEQGGRNIFPFSREPIDEIILHQTLANHNLIPIKAWTLTGCYPRGNIDYYKVRNLYAKKIQKKRS